MNKPEAPHSQAVTNYLEAHINKATGRLDTEGKQMVLEWSKNLGEKDFVALNALLFWTMTERDALIG